MWSVLLAVMKNIALADVMVNNPSFLRKGGGNDHQENYQNDYVSIPILRRLNFPAYSLASRR